MSDLFIVLFLVCLLALILGIIKPRIVIRWGALEKRNRKNVLKYYGLGLIISFILIGATINTDTKENTASTKPAVAEKKELTPEEKAAAEKKAAEDKIAAEKAAAEKVAAEKLAAEKAAAEQKAKEEAEKVAYDTGITYNQLARTPNDFIGKKTKFTGKVVQVMEGNGETQLRIAVNDNYDTILLVGYKSSIINSRVLQDDHVLVKGTSTGIITYDSTMGGKISIPGMLVQHIEIVQ